MKSRSNKARPLFARSIALALVIAILIPGVALADVGVAGQWNETTIINENGGVSPATGSYTVPAGSERLVIFAITLEHDIDRPSGIVAGPTVTFGGEELTLITETTNKQNNIWVGYITESQIPITGTATFSVAYNTTNTTENEPSIVVHAATYSGVDQSDPIVDSNTNYEVGSFTVTYDDIDVVEKGYIFFVTNQADIGLIDPPFGYTEHFDKSFSELSKSVASTAIYATDIWGQAVTFTTSTRNGLAVVSLRPSAPPTVASTSLVATYTGTGPSSFTVTFDKEISSATATDKDNYLLVEAGVNKAFDTTVCGVIKKVFSAFKGAVPVKVNSALSLGGVQPDDVKITPTSVTYDNSNPYVATVNLPSALEPGTYRLFVCGTTSIEDPAGNELNGGLSDTQVNFTVVVSTPAALPKTGFAQGRVTMIPVQPESMAYSTTEMMLEIPALGVSMPIVGVPQSSAGWNVDWLGENAGYLAGSAFPTWAGNTVITAHVWDAWNQPGPFAKLKTLKYGDQFQIKAWGMTYTYEVRESKLFTTKNVKSVFQTEEYDWVTLVTCEFYNPFTGDYLFRRGVRAVLLSVK